MAINDPVGDMLTRIRNAQMRRRGNVTTPGSRLRGRVLDVLKSEGFIRDYSTTEFGNGRTEFNIELKYFDGLPVIRSIQRVSKPGRRVYASVDTMPRVADGLGITILSTPQGVMADHGARERNVGGEVLCKVFCPARRPRPEPRERPRMSRIGKKPVAVPSGVAATVSRQPVKIKGQKGELSFVVPEEVSVAMED